MKRVFLTTLMVVILGVTAWWIATGWHFGAGAPMTVVDYATVVICIALATVIGGGLVTLLFIPAEGTPGEASSERSRRDIATNWDIRPHPAAPSHMARGKFSSRKKRSEAASRASIPPRGTGQLSARG